MVTFILIIKFSVCASKMELLGVVEVATRLARAVNVALG